MRNPIAIVAFLALLITSSAINAENVTLYSDGFSSLEGLRGEGTAGAPYPTPDGQGAFVNVTTGGYGLFWLEPATLFGAGQTVDVRGAKVSMTVRYDSDTTNHVVFFRLYSGTYSNGEWTVTGRTEVELVTLYKRQHPEATDIPYNEWFTVTFDVDADGTPANASTTLFWDPTKVFRFRNHFVHWDPGSDYQIGWGDFVLYAQTPVIEDVPTLDYTRATVEYVRQLGLAEGAGVGEVVWTLEQGPAGMAIDNTGRISGWTPSLADVGSVFDVTVKVTNGVGTATKSYQVKVNCDASTFTFDTQNTPEPGEFGTSLASDGTYVYYLKKDSGRLFRLDTAASSWTELAGAPEGGDGADCGSLAFYTGLGTQGTLITRRDVSGDKVLYTYDIAGNTWTAHGNRSFGNTGYVVIGDMLYGNAHAAAVNQGGPTTVADLKNLDAVTCQRAAFITGTGGILGGDAGWFSRAVQMATVNGKLYGIKNDWTSPNGTGDRLWTISPSDIILNQYIGPNWDNWTHSNSTATDLGQLPFEPGYGSALVALPPGWSAEIGGLGGLLIVAGRSPSNNEGWGDPSNKYALYDISSKTFTEKTLPGTTGSGTSAVFHDGKVYIKRGGQPDDPHNTDLWILSAACGDPCYTPHALNVTSSGAASVAIAMEPADCAGQAGGTTPFARSVGNGEYVTLTAPPLKGYEFLGWSLDSADPATTDATVVLQVIAPVTATAKYQYRCDNPIAFTVSTEGATVPVTIAFTPKNCAGAETAVAPFTTTFGSGETVTLAAPYVLHKTFVRWDVEGATPVDTPTLTLTADVAKNIKAVYGPEATIYRNGCWQFVPLATPVNGESSTSLASDGTFLYFMTSAGSLYRSLDGHGWLPLADVPGSMPDASDGALAFYPYLGDRGTLLTYRSLGLCAYDIATDTWSVHVNRNFGTTGLTVIGDYLYGNSHAAAVNQGGPTTVADLKDLDAASCYRAAFSGLLGRDSTWFSRVVQMTAVDDILYGIKNDWVTPASDGDRLWSIDPKDLMLNTKTGPEWYEWTHDESPANDLGLLPFEPGYGSAMAPLPAKWSCGIGADGGLLIVAGRSGSNQEGWGAEPSDAFAVFDIATQQFTSGSLPAPTGSGTSAATHKGKVYIKRGGEPDGPYNTTLWAMSLQGTSYDLNFDGHVNMDDLEIYFAPCFSGPTVPFGTITVNDESFDCRAADYDQDGDVDQADFGAFQRCLSSNPEEPLSADCQ